MMSSRWSHGTAPRVLLIGLAVAVSLTVVYGGVTSTTVFGPYNGNWEGTSNLRTLASENAEETRFVQNTSVYTTADASSAVSIVLSPDSAYTERDVEDVSQFVRNGGTLVVADDYGNNANRLLARLGASARFTGDPLRDDRHYYRSPAMVETRESSDHEYMSGVIGLTLNYGTAIEPNGSMILVNTSMFSYLDGNNNQRFDAGESLQQYPVVTIEEIGEGQVLAVGDPSIFVNAMLDRRGNRRFAQNVLGDNRLVLFDISHLDAVPPLVAARSFLRDSTAVQITGGFALVIAASYLGAVRRLRPWISDRLTQDSLAGDVGRESLESWVHDRHPEWDMERVRRISEEINRQRSE